MATDADGEDVALREIRLVQNPDGDWTARDQDRGLAAQGSSRAEALAALDDVVDAVDGEGGHEPTDEELRELGVDPDVARSQGDELPNLLE